MREKEIIVLYNLGNVVFMVVETVIPRQVLLQEMKKFRDEQGLEREYEFVENMQDKYGLHSMEVLSTEALDFENLDDYEEEEEE